MALIRAIAHRIAIMEHGQIVEEGHSQTVIDAPVSAIGRALVSAVPRLEFSS
jgi:peptide/nickel transport system ATP-binding protein